MNEESVGVGSRFCRGIVRGSHSRLIIGSASETGAKSHPSSSSAPTIARPWSGGGFWAIPGIASRKARSTGSSWPCRHPDPDDHRMITVHGGRADRSRPSHLPTLDRLSPRSSPVCTAPDTSTFPSTGTSWGTSRGRSAIALWAGGGLGNPSAPDSRRHISGAYFGDKSPPCRTRPTWPRPSRGPTSSSTSGPWSGQPGQPT